MSLALAGSKLEGLRNAADLPIPPFAVITDAPARRREEIDRAIEVVEATSGLVFGDAEKPLLLAVRSAPSVSMPGMLETLLNVGAVDTVMPGLTARLGDGAAALELRRRFLLSWGVVVCGLPRTAFEERSPVRGRGAPRTPMSVDALRDTISRHEATIRASKELPDDPRVQLEVAIDAVFRSWDSPRAREHRRASGIPEPRAMQVIVQAMVFGNATGASGAGVAFTRNPVDGTKQLFGEYLPQIQGNDITEGRSSPAGLSAASSGLRQNESLERHAPEAFAELTRIAGEVERRGRDVQELEFTVERGRLYVLQVRTAKRSPAAAVRIAVDLVREGTITQEAAVARTDPKIFEALASLAIDGAEKSLPLTTGLASSPGAASGRVVFTPEDAIAARDEGAAAILVRPDCSPEDAPGIRASKAVLTASGGLTSHAAVISRALGRPCVVSAQELRIDVARKRAEVRGAGGSNRELPATITIDGTSGRVYEGELALRTTFSVPEAQELLAWAGELDALGWDEVIARFAQQA